MDPIAPPVETPVAPATTTPTPPAAPPEAPLSLLEHAQTFSPKQADETEAQAEERRHHSAEQRRERETGKFTEGKVRHRAQSQQATPADVPRIQQLTGRAKAAEERAQAAEIELARLRAAHAPPAQIARAEARVEQAAPPQAPQPTGDGFKEAEPNEADPAFANDYAKYLRAVAKWEGRKAQWEWRQEETQAQTQARRTAQIEQEMVAWGGRMDTAAKAYPDFHEVAMQAPAPWLLPSGEAIPIRQAADGRFFPSGAAIDAFIKEDDNGGHVLYHLQTHRDEADALMRMAPIQQLKRLSLLSQRFDASTPESPQAGTTGSAAPGPRLVSLPPKPPNPVRTEAQRTGTSPPPTDGSLSVMAHAKAFKRPY